MDHDGLRLFDDIEQYNDDTFHFHEDSSHVKKVRVKTQGRVEKTGEPGGDDLLLTPPLSHSIRNGGPLPNRIPITNGLSTSNNTSVPNNPSIQNGTAATPPPAPPSPPHADHAYSENATPAVDDFFHSGDGERGSGPPAAEEPPKPRPNTVPDFLDIVDEWDIPEEATAESLPPASSSSSQPTLHHSHSLSTSQPSSHFISQTHSTPSLTPNFSAVSNLSAHIIASRSPMKTASSLPPKPSPPAPPMTVAATASGSMTVLSTAVSGPPNPVPKHEPVSTSNGIQRPTTTLIAGPGVKCGNQARLVGTGTPSGSPGLVMKTPGVPPAGVQLVNGQLVVQAQLQQVQTPNGMITVAVLPQSLVSGQVQMQMQQLLKNQQSGATTTGPKPASPAPPNDKSRPLKPKPNRRKQTLPSQPRKSGKSTAKTAKTEPPPAPEPARKGGEMSVQLSPESQAEVSRLTAAMADIRAQGSTLSPQQLGALNQLERQRTDIVSKAFLQQHGAEAARQLQLLPKPHPSQPPHPVPSPATNSPAPPPQIVNMNGQQYVMLTKEQAMAQGFAPPGSVSPASTPGTTPCGSTTMPPAALEPSPAPAPPAVAEAVPTRMDEAVGAEEDDFADMGRELEAEERRLELEQRKANFARCFGSDLAALHRKEERSVPFRSPKEALVRLMPYHLYATSDPSPLFLATVDEAIETGFSSLFQKKTELEARFSAALMRDAMVESEPCHESLISFLLQSHESDLLKQEKTLADSNPDELCEQIRALQVPVESESSSDSSSSSSSDEESTDETEKETEEGEDFSSLPPPSSVPESLLDSLDIDSLPIPGSIRPYSPIDEEDEDQDEVEAEPSSPELGLVPAQPSSPPSTASPPRSSQAVSQAPSPLKSPPPSMSPSPSKPTPHPLPSVSSPIQCQSPPETATCSSQDSAPVKASPSPWRTMSPLRILKPARMLSPPPKGATTLKSPVSPVPVPPPLRLRIPKLRLKCGPGLPASSSICSQLPSTSSPPPAKRERTSSPPPHTSPTPPRCLSRGAPDSRQPLKIRIKQRMLPSSPLPPPRKPEEERAGSGDAVVDERPPELERVEQKEMAEVQHPIRIRVKLPALPSSPPRKRRKKKRRRKRRLSEAEEERRERDGEPSQAEEEKPFLLRTPLVPCWRQVLAPAPKLFVPKLKIKLSAEEEQSDCRLVIDDEPEETHPQLGLLAPAGLEESDSEDESQPLSALIPPCPPPPVSLPTTSGLDEEDDEEEEEFSDEFPSSPGPSGPSGTNIFAIFQPTKYKCIRSPDAPKPPPDKDFFPILPTTKPTERRGSPSPVFEREEEEEEEEDVGDGLRDQVRNLISGDLLNATAPTDSKDGGEEPRFRFEAEEPTERPLFSRLLPT